MSSTYVKGGGGGSTATVDEGKIVQSVIQKLTVDGEGNPMENPVMVELNDINNISEAIKDKTGATTDYLPSQMAEAISSIVTGGGDLSGADRLFYTTGSSVNMSTLTKAITLSKKYKAIAAVMTAVFSTGYPTVTLTLETNTVSITFDGQSSGRYKTALAIDTNMGKFDVGSTYNVKYRAYYSSSTSPPYGIYVYGIY